MQLTAGSESAAGEAGEWGFASGEPGEPGEPGESDEPDTPSRAQVGRLQRLAPTGESAQAAASRLRAWVESKYTHITYREKDTGTKLDVLFSAYAAASPPVAAATRGLSGRSYSARC